MSELVHRRNRLLPLYVGFVVVTAAVAYVGWYMYTIDCSVTPLPVFLVLFVVPVVYLALIYLTLTSQK